MLDRTMQALYKFALEPVAETLADPNSYGFRLYRRCADAIAQCFNVLAKSYSPVWVIEADIKQGGSKKFYRTILIKIRLFPCFRISLFK